MYILLSDFYPTSRLQSLPTTTTTLAVGSGEYYNICNNNNHNTALCLGEYHNICKTTTTTLAVGSGEYYNICVKATTTTNKLNEKRLLNEQGKRWIPSRFLPTYMVKKTRTTTTTMCYHDYTCIPYVWILKYRIASSPPLYCTFFSYSASFHWWQLPFFPNNYLPLLHCIVSYSNIK